MLSTKIALSIVAGLIVVGVISMMFANIIGDNVILLVGVISAYCAGKYS